MELETLAALPLHLANALMGLANCVLRRYLPGGNTFFFTMTNDANSFIPQV